MPADVTALRRLAADLATAAPKARALAQTVVTKTARDIEADAKALAPVDTGMLRNSIGSDIGDLEAVVGPTVNYAPYLEDGTSRMAPRPFMGPATDRREETFHAAVAQIPEVVLRG